jgi:hypothetical protein
VHENHDLILSCFVTEQINYSTVCSQIRMRGMRGEKGRRTTNTYYDLVGRVTDNDVFLSRSYNVSMYLVQGQLVL